MIYTESSLTRYLTAWCQQHLGDHASGAYRDYHQRFQDALDAKRKEQLTRHSNAGLFGISGAGGCLRANALNRAGVPGKPEDGDSMVTFEVGHLLECMALAVLGAAGFGVTRMQETIRLEPAFQSAIDGVLVDGPAKIAYPLVLSVKTASYKSSSPPRGNYPAKRYGFAQLPLDGVRKAQPGWYIQSQLEMAATSINRSLVLCIAKDMIAAFRGDAVFEQNGSLSWYAEILKADKDLFDPKIGPIPNAYANLLGAPHASHTEPAVPILDDEAGLRWARLPSPGDVASHWKGPNQQATGTFNYCYGCKYGGMPEVCK